MIVDPVHSNSSQRDTRRACEESGKFWRREVGREGGREEGEGREERRGRRGEGGEGREGVSANAEIAAKVPN